VSELTRRQQGIVDFIRTFRRTHAYGPTIREITDSVGLSSTSVATYNLHALRRLGLVSWVDGRARTVELAEANPDAKVLVKVWVAECDLPLLQEGQMKLTVAYLEKPDEPYDGYWKYVALVADS